MTAFIGAGSYLDRHGKRRWRYRRNGRSVGLPGNPAASDTNAAAYLAATIDPPRKVRRKTLADAEHNCRRFFEESLKAIHIRCYDRGTAFNLTVDHLVALSASTDFKCAISRLPMEFSPRKSRRGRQPFMASVDRIDSALGYEIGNVRIVCLIVNIARSDFGDDALFRMASAIAVRRAA